MEFVAYGTLIGLIANCATWTLERIELLKRCLHAGFSCGQTAREIGVTRLAGS
jgi:hypothetical protein